MMVVVVAMAVDVLVHFAVGMDVPVGMDEPCAQQQFAVVEDLVGTALAGHLPVGQDDDVVGDILDDIQVVGGGDNSSTTVAALQ